MWSKLKVSRRNLLSAAAASWAVAGAKATAAAPAKAARRPALTISKETTGIEGPLDADGYVDYRTALNDFLRGDSTPATNGAIDFFRAVGPKHIEEPWREESFRLLGMEALPEQGDYFLEMHDFAVQDDLLLPPADADTCEEWHPSVVDEQLSTALNRPWSAQEFPELAAWLNKNEAPMRAIARALHKPHFYVPVVGSEESLDTMSLHVIMSLRELTRAFAVRAMLRLQHQPGAAWQDVLRVFDCARAVSFRGFMIDRLVGHAISGVAEVTAQRVVRHAKLTRSDLQSFRRALSSLRPLRSFSEVFSHSERHYAMHYLMYMAKHGLHSVDPSFYYGQERLFRLLCAARWEPDWDEVNRISTTWWNRYEEVAKQPVDQQPAALAELQKQWTEVQSRHNGIPAVFRRFGEGEGVSSALSRHVGVLHFASSMVCVPIFFDSEHRRVVQSRLTQLVLRLALYQVDNGRYPASLQELQTFDCEGLPLDVFTGKSLVYRREGEGYILYSLGRNGRDDTEGSSPRPDNEMDFERDDIVVRMQPVNAG